MPAAVEPGTPAAVVLGLLYFTLLTGAGLAVGLGLLALLRFPTDPTRRLLLAPFAATMAWALAGNLLVRSGFTMAQATPPILIISLGLAALGVALAIRMRLRPRLAALVVGVGLVVGLVTWPYFARGLTAQVGSPNMDTFVYTSIAASFWHYGLDPTSASLPFFERYLPISRVLGPGRNHTYVLLALLSPLVEPGEPIFVRNLFVCWSIFVIASSLAFYRASWAGPKEEASLSEMLFYVFTTAGIGWAVVPALVGNWDHGLFVSVGPVLAALATEMPRGVGWALFLGGSLAYAGYTYPELAPILGLFLLPIYLPRLRERAAQPGARVTFTVVAATCFVLLSPGLRSLWTYFLNQLRGAHTTQGLRPGGYFARGLVDAAADPSAWWALGGEHLSRPEPSWVSLWGLWLTGVALAGAVRLARRQNRGEVWSLALLCAGLGYFVLVDRYAYAAYKLLSTASWLVGRCLVEGATAICAPARASTGVLGGRLVRRALAGTTVLVLLASLVVAHRSRLINYFHPGIAARQPSIAGLVRLRDAARSQLPTDLLVAGSFGELTLPWIFYALKDTPLRPYHGWNLSPPVPGGAGLPPDGSPPTAVLLPARDYLGVPAQFRTPEFALIGLDEVPVVERIDNPNGLEDWGTWLGTQPITVALLSRPGRAMTLSFEATPGPSLPGTPRREILLRSGAREVGRTEIDGRSTVVFRVTTGGGREVLTLSTPQTPTVAVQRNGDTRPLLVGIRNLRVGPAADGPIPRGP